MKKILIFSIAYYPKYVGGAEVAIKEITDRIDDVEFHLITLKFSDELREEKIGNVFVHRIGVGSAYISKILFIPLATLKAFTLHKKHFFNGFWAMMSYMLFPIVFLRFIGLKVPYALTLQEGDTFEHVYLRLRMKPFLFFLKKGILEAEIIQTISNFLASWPLKFGYTGKVLVIPNGASVEKNVTYTEEELNSLKREVNKKPGDIFIINVSRLVHKNAVDDCIRALKFLPENVKLLSVGGGEDVEKLKKLVRELNLEERVVFTGHVDRKMTAKYRAISDIFARPSRSEGMGNSFASAMASRLPIIATQEGGLADFIFDEERNPQKNMTAWVVDKDSPEQIARAVERILSDKEKVKKVTDYCYKLVFENYNWDFIAKDMREKVFLKLWSK